jgi:UDP-glucose 4-epimerase
MSQKRILVTGSNGFIGRNLVEELKKCTTDVVALTYPNGNRIDIRDWKRIKEMEDIHMVYHLAAITQVPFSFENPREVYAVNVLGTLNILELCRLHDIKKIVFASSYVYGQPRYLPIDEKHPVQPTNPYARSKVMGEDLCKAYYEDYGLKCIILRAFNIYGEDQSENFLIPSILKQLVKDEIELNNPEPKRDFIYIKDAISAYVKAGEYDGSGFEIFNIGSGRSYSVDEIVRKLIDSSGRNVAVTYQNKRRKNEIMNTISDYRKAKEKLCWEASVSIDEGLKITLENYKKRLKF